MCFGQSNQSQSMWRIENSPVLILRSARAFACIRGAPGASLSQRNCPVALNLPSDLRGRQSQHARRARSPEFAAIKRSEEHTSELQSRSDLVCRLLLEKKKKKKQKNKHKSTDTKDDTIAHYKHIEFQWVST